MRMMSVQEGQINSTRAFYQRAQAVIYEKKNQSAGRVSGRRELHETRRPDCRNLLSLTLTLAFIQWAGAAHSSDGR